MNATIGDWLFSTLGAQQSRALLKVPPPGAPAEPFHPAILGVFDPAQGAVFDLMVNPAAFQARYGLTLSDLFGSEIGEGQVPDKSELQGIVRGTKNPCLLDNNQNYVVTEIDVLDFRYVAKNGSPVWDGVKNLHIFDPQPAPQPAPQPVGGDGQLQAAQDEISRLKALVPVDVPADIDETVSILKEAGPALEIGPGLKARFGRLGRFIESLKARKP